MSIISSDIIVYGSINMREADAGAQGGGIDTSRRVVFDDIAPTGNLEVVSSAGGDTTQTVTATGRDPEGNIVSEGKTLSGTTPVAMTVQTSWERILKGLKSLPTTGDVAIQAVTKARSNTLQDAGQATSVQMAFATLDAGASAVDDFYNGMVLRTISGTGPNQIRRVIDYDGAAKRAYVNRDWDVLPDATTTFSVAPGMVFESAPFEILEVRRPFYNVLAEAAGGAARDYYEKVFFRNNNGALALTSAEISELSDPSGLIDFGLAGTLDDAGSSSDRRTAPGGITFDSVAKPVANSQSHSPGSGQGCWLHLSLPAGTGAQKTTYTLRESGATT